MINGSDADRALVEQSLDEIETALSGDGEAVATVCLVGDRYAHGSMVEVQLQLASEDAPLPKIGDRYFTHPPKSVVSDAVLDTIALRTMRECWDAAEYTVSRSQARAKIQNIIRAAIAAALGVKS